MLLGAGRNSSNGAGFQPHFAAHFAHLINGVLIRQRICIAINRTQMSGRIAAAQLKKNYQCILSQSLLTRRNNDDIFIMGDTKK